MYLLGLKTEEMEGGRIWSSLELRTRSSHLKPVSCFVSPVPHTWEMQVMRHMPSHAFMHIQFPLILYLWYTINISNQVKHYHFDKRLDKMDKTCILIVGFVMVLFMTHIF